MWSVQLKPWPCRLSRPLLHRALFCTLTWGKKRTCKGRLNSCLWVCKSKSCPKGMRRPWRRCLILCPWWVSLSCGSAERYHRPNGKSVSQRLWRNSIINNTLCWKISTFGLSIKSAFTIKRPKTFREIVLLWCCFSCLCIYSKSLCYFLIVLNYYL